MAFIHYFSAAQQSFSKEDVSRMSTDAVKAVVKTRIKIETTELKKIIDLWTSIHTPVIKQYHENVADENMFLNFHELIETCVGFNLKTGKNNNKIAEYLQNLLHNSIEHINNMYNEVLWEKATGFYIKYVPYDKSEVRLHYVQHLKNLISVSNESRRIKLIDRLVVQYENISRKSIYNNIAYTQTIFYLVDENKVFDKYFTVFEAIRNQHKYNLKLIELLVENKQWKLAEINCKN